MKMGSAAQKGGQGRRCLEEGLIPGMARTSMCLESVCLRGESAFCKMREENKAGSRKRTYAY